MLIGVPREIKDQEHRVGLTPASVREIAAHGHDVIVETDAGGGIGATDADYTKAGAKIAPGAEDVFARAEMIVKVKEPQAVERKRLKRGQVLFTYLHLAPDPEQTRDLIASGAVCIAYETITDARGGLPLLAPMSEVAGRMAVQAGAHCLEKAQGGMGILLGGVVGVPPAKIVVLGAGVVGANAAQIAVGSGAHVVVLDRNIDKLRHIEDVLGARAVTVFSNQDNLERHVFSADLVIGAVLVPGGRAPQLVSEAMVRTMKPRSVIVDCAIDQGGSVEHIHETSHAEPVYEVAGVLHYAVGNIPAAVPHTSTYALTNATLPYAVALATRGVRDATASDADLAHGVNTVDGEVVNAAVADALGRECTDLADAIAR
jgi:alanine dehydrogenase